MGRARRRFVVHRHQAPKNLPVRPGKRRGSATWQAPERSGLFCRRESGGFVAGLQSGLHHFDPPSGAFSLIVEVDPDFPTIGSMTAVVDAEGRIWFGTMDNGERARNGAFYCFDGGELKRTSLDRHRHHQRAGGLARRGQAVLGRHNSRHHFRLSTRPEGEPGPRGRSTNPPEGGASRRSDRG